MSAFCTKRTSACALHMSAFDPKRILAFWNRARIQPYLQTDAIRIVFE